MQYAYKVDCFDCTFMGKEKYRSKLEELLNIRAQEGWELFSSEVSGEGSLCTVIFRRDANVAIKEKY